MISSKRVAKSGIIGIPVKLRRELNIQGGDVLDVSTDENGNIILKPHNRRCVLCSGTDRVVLFEGKGICKKCAKMVLEVEE